MWKKYGNELVVGVFVLACMALLVFMYTRIKQSGVGDGQMVYASFDTVGGLIPDSPVTIAGVRVGKVGTIAVKEGRAWVQILLNRGVVIRQKDQAAILAKSLLGEKVLAIYPGPRQAPPIPRGGTIQRTKPTVDVTDLFGAIKPLVSTLQNLGPELRPLGKELTLLVRNLNNAFKGDPKGSRRLVRNLGNLLQEGTTTVRLINKMLRRNRRNLRGTLWAINRLVRDKRLGQIVGDLQQTARQMPELTRRLDRTTRQLNRVLKAVPNRTLRRLPRVVDSAARMIKNLEVATGGLRKSRWQIRRILRHVDLILAKVARIDEADVREFLQVEGIALQLFKGKAAKRVRALRQQKKQKKKARKGPPKKR